MSHLSGQITVAVAGAAIPGPAVEGSYFAVKAHPANVDTVWLGNDGHDHVNSSSGFPLDPGEGVEVFVRSLRALYFDANHGGDKVCWYRVT